MWACTAARLLPLLAAAAALALLPTAAAQINSAGQPLLTATAAVSGDHSFFFELPVQPGGCWAAPYAHGCCAGWIEVPLQGMP
jgi:hypothetical protein